MNDLQREILEEFARFASFAYEQLIQYEVWHTYRVAIASECKRERQAFRRKCNPSLAAKQDAQALAWKRANPEKRKAILRAHYYRDVEKTRAKHRAWRAKHREALAAKRRADPDLNAKKRAWYHANKAKKCRAKVEV